MEHNPVTAENTAPAEERNREYWLSRAAEAEERLPSDGDYRSVGDFYAKAGEYVKAATNYLIDGDPNLLIPLVKAGNISKAELDAIKEDVANKVETMANNIDEDPGKWLVGHYYKPLRESPTGVSRIVEQYRHQAAATRAMDLTEWFPKTGESGVA